MKKPDYIKLVRWSDEDQCFIGSIPDLCGDCCDGESQKEVYLQLLDIEGGWIEAFDKEGKEYPPARVFPYKKLSAVAGCELQADKIRLSLGLTQTEFAEVLKVPVKTLRKWEQGETSPSGAAQSLLKIAAVKPELLLQAL
ncbi:helix-turn-helix domain-containing protein [Persicirhabdus sediminis]|uniref:Helix-turn-helix domain-containing protein n=1 Tax=Persicirhabdus sediminis TaxID=454144 RepID=A0A8J7MJJ5_9BACT|nr:helix-turn-helix domain-containing protein [Persicirhabdus sediminis]MBK1792178.1 helix-turn-helix domain-containing protein [Persicirhabdus sediminis]